MTHEKLKQLVADRIREVITLSDGSFEDSAKEVLALIHIELQDPTEEMLRAVSPINGNRVWQAMLNTSPLAGDKRGK